MVDLVRVVEGGDASQALSASLALAQTAEACGYPRYCVAEHHTLPGVASAATAVVIGRPVRSPEASALSPPAKAASTAACCAEAAARSA